jgi:hypothetical protein
MLCNLGRQTVNRSAFAALVVKTSAIIEHKPVWRVILRPNSIWRPDLRLSGRLYDVLGLLLWGACRDSEIVGRTNRSRYRVGVREGSLVVAATRRRASRAEIARHTTASTRSRSLNGVRSSLLNSTRSDSPAAIHARREFQCHRCVSLNDCSRRDLAVKRRAAEDLPLRFSRREHLPRIRGSRRLPPARIRWRKRLRGVSEDHPAAGTQSGTSELSAGAPRLARSAHALIRMNPARGRRYRIGCQYEIKRFTKAV